MTRLRRVWDIGAWPDQAPALAARLGVHPLVAAVLMARGLDEARARAFLRPGPAQLHDPFALPDMAPAVDRILAAVRAGEKILVYGDYDVDGLAAVCILLEALAALGAAAVGHYIPHRLREGYGVHAAALEAAARAGVGLVITVDCGISAHAALAAAARAGVDVIVTDHHRPGPCLPPARAVVAGSRPDSLYPGAELAGAGVAFKLYAALAQASGQGDAGSVLDLVALGTIADVVPLIGENRALVALGLQALNRAPRPGLAALAGQAGARGPLAAEQVAFWLAPRLNAAGRLAHAELALELLRAPGEAEARAAAARLEGLNQERQALEGRVLDQALHIIAAGGMQDDPVLVVAAAGWHPGVLGIAASRLVERYWRPVLLLSLEGGRARGSGRSIPGFDLYAALSHCAGVLDEFGGHAEAAGLSLSAQAVDGLRRELGRRAERVLPPAARVPRLAVDAEVKLGDLGAVLLRDLDLLGPHGAGNPWPLLVARDVVSRGLRRLGGSGAHLGFTVTDASGCSLPAVAFRAGERAGELFGRLDLAFRPELDSWQGNTRLRLVVEDWRPAGDGVDGEELYSAVTPLDCTPLPRPPEPVPPPPGPPPAVVDRRGRDPVDVLAEAAGSGVVIGWALEPGHAHHLTAAVRARGVGAQYYSRGLPPAYRQLLEEMFEQGRTPVLVSPDPGDWWPRCPAVTVWCTPPASPALFRARSGRSARTWLGFGPPEVDAAASFWSALAPDRNRLAAVYRLLSGLERQLARPVPYARAALAAERVLGGAGRAGLEVALEVFGELGLTRVEQIDGEAAIIMLPAPAGRLDLETSDALVRRRQHWSGVTGRVGQSLGLELWAYQNWLEDNIRLE